MITQAKRMAIAAQPQYCSECLFCKRSWVPPRMEFAKCTNPVVNRTGHVRMGAPGWFCSTVRGDGDPHCAGYQQDNRNWLQRWGFTR